jgi:hypothetical protein
MKGERFGCKHNLGVQQSRNFYISCPSIGRNKTHLQDLFLSNRKKVKNTKEQIYIQTAFKVKEQVTWKSLQNLMSQ